MPRSFFTTHGADRIDGRDFTAWFPQSRFLNLSNASCREPEVTRSNEDLLSPVARHSVCGIVVYAGSQRAKAALALTRKAALLRQQVEQFEIAQLAQPRNPAVPIEVSSDGGR